MIPAITSKPQIFHKVQISTGNILNVDNKLGRKSSEELLDSLKLTLQCSDIVSNSNNAAGKPVVNGTDGKAHVVEINEADGRVLRATSELNQKLTENERPELSIGAKIFINKHVNANDSVDKAVEALLDILKVQHVDNVILAYHPHPKVSGNGSLPATPTITDGGGAGSPAASGNPFRWGSYCDETLEQLKQLWTSLEKYAQEKRISQLGVSDLDGETLSKLHETARVPPTIAQINLESCCVVPPPLQDFCTKHDIQLLTHSDPEVLLPDDKFIIPGYTVDWVLRYQVHVRCRGVLTAKGYILGASKTEEKHPSESHQEAVNN